MTGLAAEALDGLPETLAAAGAPGWAEALPSLVQAALAPGRHGRLPEWQSALASLPDVRPGSVDFTAGAVRLGEAGDLDSAARGELVEALSALKPWRKGPFELYGVPLDAEWRSDLKWARLAEAIEPLAGRRVLDVGAGNGYYALRMLGAGAEWVLGLDPTLLYVMQWLALRRLAGAPPAWVLPLGIEAVPPDLKLFDTVFSLGVLYHRRSPIDHLTDLLGCLAKGGELVLETLVVEGDETTALVPHGRYARMKNVWFIPSEAMLRIWLRRSGFTDMRTVAVTPTTPAEQRVTDWSGDASLADFLDPQAPARTAEGYPAPRRAIVLARAGR